MAATSEKPPTWPILTSATAPSTGRTSTPDIPTIESLHSIPSVAAAIYPSASLYADTTNDTAPSAHMMFKKDMSFTPRRAKAPPRAWERRPAVPFVQRNDGQKIWKRVPLGELGVEATKEISLREEKERADYVRTVKRQKIDPTTQSNQQSEVQEPHEEVENNSDKENAETCQEKGGAVQKQQNFAFTFVGTKTEENLIEAGASPRKKVRRPEVLASSDAVDGVQLQVDDLQQTESHLQSDEQKSTERIASEIIETQINEQEPITTEQIDTTLPERLLPDSNGDIASNTEAESVLDQSPNSDKGTDLPEVEMSFDVEPTPLSTTTAGLQEGIPFASESEETKLGDSLAAPLESWPEEQQDTGTKEEIAEPKCDLDSRVSEDLTDMTAGLGNERSLSAPSRMVEDDDTAFLHDFLSRAKAQRAAREIQALTASQQQATTTIAQQSGSRPLEDSNTKAQSSIPPLPSSTYTPVLDAPSAEEDLAASPLRRSKRTATIRSTAQASRNKTLPNPIQLKRANGNEFIFTANKTQGAANVALLTRSNTKRNKGTASSVVERLRQLNGQKDDSSQQNPDSTPALDGPSAENITSKMSAVKKRKREKRDTTSKAKKALRWNEEELIRYREPSPVKWAENDDLEDHVETPAVDSEAQVARKALQSSMNETLEIPDSDVSAQSEKRSKSRSRRK